MRRLAFLPCATLALARAAKVLLLRPVAPRAGSPRRLVALAGLLLATAAPTRDAAAVLDGLGWRELWEECYDLNGDLDKALAACDEALLENRIAGSNRGLSNAHRGRARVYAKKGEHDKARKDFDESIKFDPANYAAYVSRSQYFNERREFDKAIADATKTLSLQAPADWRSSAHNNRGWAYEGKGDLQQARLDYQKAIEHNASNNVARENLARLERRLANAGQGQERAASPPRGVPQPTAKAPDDARGTEWTAEAERCYQNTRKAEPDQGSVIAACDRALESGKLSTVQRAYTFGNRGAAYERKGDYDRAIRDYDQAIRLKPNHAMAFNNRGYAYELKGDLAQAERDYRKALALDPKYEKAKNNLARIAPRLAEARAAEAKPRPDEESARRAEERRRAEEARAAEQARRREQEAAQQELVARVQRLLGRFAAAARDNAFDPGTPDGKAGRRTVEAIKAFQRREGLPATGAIDDALLERLEPAIAEADTIHDPPRGQRDTTPPVIEPEAARLATEADTVRIAGRVRDDRAGVALLVDGVPVTPGPDGAFAHEAWVRLGESRLALVARDAAGNSAEVAVTVVRKRPAPRRALPPLDPRKARAQARPNAVALIVGVEAYQRLPEASYATHDARAFYDYARHGLGVPEDAIVVLDEPARTTRLAILGAVEREVKPRIQRGVSEVFLLFAGHGLAAPDGSRLYLLPADADVDLLAASALDRDELLRSLGESGPKAVTAFLDTCFSGLGRDAGREPVALVEGQRRIGVRLTAAAGPQLTVLAAASGAEAASGLEPVGHGAFSYFLMRALEGATDADADRDRVLTAGELHAWLGREVPGAVGRLGRRQTPQLDGDPRAVVARF